MAYSLCCDSCGEEITDDEMEFAFIEESEALCAFCNSYEGDVDPDDLDGRYED